MTEPWTPATLSSQQDAVCSTPQAACGATQCCECLGPQDPAPAPAPPTPVITHVEWLDGAADGVLSGEGTQFVNLPVDDKWVGGRFAANRRRLGCTPGFKVTFDQPGEHAFHVKLAPGGSNAVYTVHEKPRLVHFRSDATWVDGTTDADGTKVVATGPAITVAGNDTWQLEAHDEYATVVSSGTLRTLRAAYLLQVKMDGLAAIAPSIANAIGEYDSHYIRLVELPAATIARIPNVGTDTGPLETAVATAWTGSQGPAKAPYAIAVVFTDHLAVKNPGQVLTRIGVRVGPGRPVVNIPVVGPGLTDPAVDDHALWRDIVPGEDWFVSASFAPDDGSDAVDIPADKCTPSPARTGWSSDVHVDVTGLDAGTGTITLTVDWVDRMRGGVSLGGGATVVVCTRAWWQTISANDQNCTLVHELGHQFGMVPTGADRTLDAHEFQYTGHGHVGSHCRKGVARAAGYGDDASLAASRCVMFGTVNGRIAFCGDCAPQVRKVDLTAGW